MAGIAWQDLPGIFDMDEALALTNTSNRSQLCNTEQKKWGSSQDTMPSPASPAQWAQSVEASSPAVARMEASACVDLDETQARGQGPIAGLQNSSAKFGYKFHW